jgi:hypothetical protein
MFGIWSSWDGGKPFDVGKVPWGGVERAEYLGNDPIR